MSFIPEYSLVFNTGAFRWSCLNQRYCQAKMLLPKLALRFIKKFVFRFGHEVHIIYVG